MENRLISASGAKNAQLKYDPLGRLYETNNGSGGGVTRFLYDGDALVAEYNSAGTMVHRYVHGNGVDQPLVWYDGGTVNATNRRHMFANWQGSITAITDASGNVVQVNAYDAYGIPNATNLGRFQYTGQILIPEIGIYHYKARAYSPYLGRFLQTDPIGYEDQFNLYAYVGNDPVNGNDPSGKERCQGTESDCGRVSAGAQRVRDMAAKTPEGSELRATADAMGEPGKGSLIIADPEATAPVFDSEKGAIVVGPSVTGANPDLVGQTLTHEVTHEIDQKEGGDMKTGDERMEREERAYNVQNEYRGAMGWKPIDAKGFAKDSFQQACKGGNSTHGSCQ